MKSARVRGKCVRYRKAKKKWSEKKEEYNKKLQDESLLKIPSEAPVQRRKR